MFHPSSLTKIRPTEQFIGRQKSEKVFCSVGCFGADRQAGRQCHRIHRSLFDAYDDDDDDGDELGRGKEI